MQTVYALIIVILGCALYLAIRTRPKAALIMLMGAAFFAWIRQAELADGDTTFRASPTSLSMTINHANVTILQMQRMVGLLGEAVIDIDRYSGALDGVPERVKQRHREKLDSILADLKDGSDATNEVHQAEHGEDAVARASTVYQAASAVLPTSGVRDQRDFNNAYNDAWTHSESRYDVITPEAFAVLFRDFGIRDAAAIRALNDYTDFYNDAQRIDN